MITTGAQRRHIVAQAMANQRLEGWKPDETDLARMQDYIAGKLSAADLLDLASAEARRSKLQE